MDIVTYVLCKKYTDQIITSLPSGFTYKGAVNYYKDLPADAKNGDVYTVVYKGESGTEPLGLNYACFKADPSSEASWIQIATLQGPKGEKGDKGDKGDKGNKGDTGATGPQGIQGPKGPKGDQGIQGETGEQGPKGDTGTFDSVAASVDANTGTPRVDVTYDSKNVNFAFHNLKGTTGAQGPQGEQGPKGEDGEPGATGPQGPQGIQGIQGAQGPKGDDGAKGDKGDKGDKGADGAGALMERNFTTGVTVGFLEAGYSVTADMKTSDILYKILYGSVPPTVPDKIWYYAGTGTPTTITSDWTNENLTQADVDSYKEHDFVLSAKGNLGIAVPKKFGTLQHIKMGESEQEQITAFDRSEITYDNVTYYMYLTGFKTTAATYKTKLLWK